MPNKPLQVLSNLPPTPGRQVRYLKDELVKKDAENEALKNNVTDLTKALNSLQIVSDKVGDIENIAPNALVNKDKIVLKKPVPAKTAYKYFCDDYKGDATGKDLRSVWKETQDKAKYVEQAAKDKLRFDSENAVYEEQLSLQETEENALKMYYDKQKQDLAMQFYEAHLEATAAANKPQKKKKDPNAPKKPISSFFFYCQDKREALAKKNPDKSPTEISKLLGEQWTKLKDTKKGTKKYDTMAEKDKLRYEEEKREYDALIADRNSTIEQERQLQLQNDKEKALELMKQMQVRHDTLVTEEPMEVEKTPKAPEEKKKKKKDPNAPKAAKSSYIFFCVEKREEIVAKHPGSKPTEITKLLAEEWKLVKEAGGTGKYDVLSAEDKLRYENEKKLYEAKKE